MPRIVVLDGHTLNPGDLDWSPLIALGETAIFPGTPQELILKRAAYAEILVVNKVRLDQEIISQLPVLQCIVISATGYDNVDVAFAKTQNICVCNAVGYSTDSVAQHVFALLLALVHKVKEHHDSVTRGDWAASPFFSYHLQPIMELRGKNFGIYGFGKIGEKTAEIASAFGMKVLAHKRNPESDLFPDIEFVTFEELLRRSDVLSLHAPLNESNFEIFNLENFKKMKSTALLINTARGKLVNEDDLKLALEQEIIAGAALDVLHREPPSKDLPLIGTKNCIITPHLAWSTREARQRLLKIVADNIEAFLRGEPENIL